MEEAAKEKCWNLRLIFMNGSHFPLNGISCVHRQIRVFQMHLGLDWNFYCIPSYMDADIMLDCLAQCSHDFTFLYSGINYYSEDEP